MNPSHHWLDQTKEIILTLDPDANITFLNPAAERLFGDSAAGLLGKPFSTVLDPFSHEKARLMLAQTLAQGGVIDWELDHIQPSGPPILIGYSTTRLQTETGEIVGVGAVGHDLTSKLELTARLAQTNQRLEGALLQMEKTHAELQATQVQLVQSEKMRSLGQMVAGVAHEINNPAGFVINNLAELSNRVPGLHALFDAYAALKAQANVTQLAAIASAEANVHLDYLWQDLDDLVGESRDGMERIRQIVLALRSFSRLDEPTLQEYDINGGLTSTLRIVVPMCRDRITIHTALGELRLLLCHPGELNQVFLNLLVNATQAIEGQGNIWVTSEHQGRMIIITIRDDGKGMNPDTLTRLGEPFFTTKPIGSGTGMGLAVSSAIVARHRGRLQFASTPGGGTTVRVELPLTHDLGKDL